MNKAKEISISLLDQLLNDRTEKEIEFAKFNMLLAKKIDDARKTKGLKKNELATKLGKKPETITRWLSGVHNFTAKTLWEIGWELDIDLINYQDKKVKGILNELDTKIETQIFPLFNYKKAIKVNVYKKQEKPYQLVG